MPKPKPQTDRNARDHQMLADPDIRGVVNKGRRGKGDDYRYPNGNNPEKIERLWRREGKG